MERELWRRVYSMVRSLGRSRRRRQVQFADAVIVLVHLWAVLHDRPVSWACDLRNWAGRRPRRLPSNATMSRRLRTASVREFLDAAEARLRRAGVRRAGDDGFAPGGPVKAVDGKPLPVGGQSKDPDARLGHGAGGLAKGYKLHAIWGDGPLPCAWDVRPMNEAEPAGAAELLPAVPGWGDLLGDAAYDSNPLAEAAAAAGHQLVAPRKRPGTGLGHRKHSPHRLRSIELLAGDFGRALHRLRGEIERRFARLTNPAGGLGPLPNWVRRLRRVRQWVQGKLLLHALRLLPEPAG